MKNSILYAPAILATALIGSASTSVAKTVPADLILRNGAVYVVEPEGEWAQAVAVRDGKIAAVGTDLQIDRLCSATITESGRRQL